MEDEPKDIEIKEVVEKIHLINQQVKLSKNFSKVIKAGTPNSESIKVKIVGGDDSAVDMNSIPTIIIEKDGEEIAKIIVQCPCGRHAELICKYDDDDNPVTPE